MPRSLLPRLVATAAVLLGFLTPAALAAPTWLPAEPTGAGGLVAALQDDGSAPGLSFGAGSISPILAADRPARGPFGTGVPLPSSPLGASYKLETLPDGTIVALLGVVDSGAATLAVTERRPGGVWGDLRQLGATDEGLSGLDSAIAPDGTLLVVWVSGNRELHSAEREPDGTWGPVEDVAGTKADHLSLKVDASGRATLASTLNAGNFTLQVADRPRGGTWTSTDLLSTPKELQSVGLSIDHDGRRWMFWSERGNSNPPGTVITPGRIVFRTSADGITGWGPDQPGPAMVDEEAEPLIPVIDRTGELTLIWGEGTFKDLKTLRVATRAGDSWAPSTALSTPSGVATNFGVRVANLTDSLLVGWSGESDGAYVARRSGGAWASPTLLASGLTILTSLSTRPDGDALVTYSTMTSTVPRTFAGALRALDVNGPRVGAIAAPGATAGAAATVSVDAIDRLSEIGSVVWDFGDGSTGTSTGSTTITHTWAQPGTFTVKATATDAVGNSTSGQATVTVAAAPIRTPTPTPAPTPAPAPSPARAPGPQLKLLADGFGKQLLLGKRRIPVVLSCGRYDCSVRLRATLTVGKRTVGTLPTVRGKIAARKKKTFFLETTVAQRRTMRAAVRRGRDAAVRVRVTAVTSAGTSRATQRISLRDLG